LMESDLKKSMKENDHLLEALKELRKTEVSFSEKFMKHILEDFDDGHWLQHGDFW